MRKVSASTMNRLQAASCSGCEMTAKLCHQGTGMS